MEFSYKQKSLHLCTQDLSTMSSIAHLQWKDTASITMITVEYPCYNHYQY